MNRFLLLLLLPLSIFANMNIAVSYPYIGALTKSIGGEHVDTVVLAKGKWDPHFVVPRPSLISKVRAADALIMWFLINGGLSAIGTIIARGHPLTILTAFVAAPLTSLNPAIAAGWVAGYVEFKLRKPVIKDFQTLSKMDNTKDFFNNKVIRLLMVVALANLGSMIGTIVAFPYIANLVTGG